tara:strand:- start:1983 stop:2801 length:819 start_codon:yes stop_codon:yes gene_type:complete
MNILPKLTDAILQEIDGVVTLSMNRNDVRNALTGTALANDIVTACEWINANTHIGTLIITGVGSAFSAGGNIFDIHNKQGMFSGSPMEIQESYRNGIQRMVRAIYSIEVPTLAAVNGAAIGAGFDLACMCDIRIGSDTAKLGETFVNLGIIPGDGGAWFLPRIVGTQRAAELTFSGRIINAVEAREIGVFLEICPPDELMKRCEALARTFSSKPRSALRLAKRLLRAGNKLELSDFLDYCASLQSLCHTTQEHADAVAAMVDSVTRATKATT